MKLDSKGKIVLSIVAVVFVIFNILFFLIADTAGINVTTIISWIFMILGFASFLLFAYLSGKKKGASTLMIMRLTIMEHCIIYLIVDFVLAVFFTILGSFVNIYPVWSISIQLIAFGVHIIIVLACLMTKTAMEEVEIEVKQKTARIKTFRVDAAMLVEYCTDENAKNDFRKFADAVKYSDPMSCDALAEIEDELEQVIAEMKHLLKAGEVEAAHDKCQIAFNILKERNKKCLMYK